MTFIGIGHVVVGNEVLGDVSADTISSSIRLSCNDRRAL